MSESKDKPAFPRAQDATEGMSLQAYAAIHLKVPLSGTPWLDEMIQKTRRDEFAKFVTNAIMGDPVIYSETAQEAKSIGIDVSTFISRASYEMANALIKASDEGMGEK